MGKSRILEVLETCYFYKLNIHGAYRVKKNENIFKKAGAGTNKGLSSWSKFHF
jgi:hypothetical protein